MLLPRAALQALLVLDRRGVCFQRTWVLYELMQVRERKKEEGTDLFLLKGLNRGAGVHPSHVQPKELRLVMGDGIVQATPICLRGALLDTSLLDSPVQCSSQGG